MAQTTQGSVNVKITNKSGGQCQKYLTGTDLGKEFALSECHIIMPDKVSISFSYE
jgi:hypothetical protein